MLADMKEERRQAADGELSGWRRLGNSRPLRIGFSVISLGILLFQVPVLLEAASAPNFNGYGGIDYQLYMDVTRRWMHGGPFYETYQLAGPYSIGYGDVLYPPVALLLFVPFTFLPPAWWWAIPLAITLLVVVRLRPSATVWPLLAACAAWQPAHIHIISGNPVIWCMAAIALGTIYKWPSVFVLIKPSLFLFALFGAPDRNWWCGVAVFGLLCALFVGMWPDWVSAVLNSRGGGLLYSWQEGTLLMLPILAWLGRPRGRYGHGERRSVVTLAQ